MYVFAYGSLMSPASAGSAIHGLTEDRCIPALLAGHVRVFDVAFPNDGSQPDKAYIDADGNRPPVVLFANVRQAGATDATNGVLLPVAEGDVERLVDRERRYDLVDVSPSVRPYDAWAAPAAPILAFVGRPQFTDPDSVDRGVLGTDYAGTIESGVAAWARRCPGFDRDFAASTRTPPRERIVPLRRVAG
jgi:hypothetical protein